MSATAKRSGAVESIRKFCVACMGGSYVLVAECDHPACPLYAYRLGVAGDAEAPPPIRAIRRQCMQCCCGERAHIRGCAASPSCKAPFEPCQLWRFRLGSRPEILERRKRKARRTSLTLPGLNLTGRPTAQA